MLSTRLMLRMNCSPFCFVIALLYIECLRTDCGVRFTSHNAHTLFLTATVVSTKYLDDQFFFNKHYAHLGGIAPTVFNDMERTLLSLLDYSLPFDVCHFEQFFHRIRDTVYPPLAGSQLSAKTESSDLSIVTKQPSNPENAVFADRALQSVYSSQSASQRRPRTPQTRSAAGKLLDGPGRPQCHPADAPSHHRRTKSLDVAHYFYPLPPTLSYSLFRYRSCRSVQQTLSWGNNGSPPPVSSPNDPEGLTGSFFFTDKQSSLPPVTHLTTTSFAFPLAHLLQMKGIQPSSSLFPTLPPSLAVTPPVGTSVSPVFFSPTQPASSPATLANPTAPPHPNTADPAVLSASKAPHLGTAAIEPQQPRAAPLLSPEEHRRVCQLPTSLIATPSWTGQTQLTCFGARRLLPSLRTVRTRRVLRQPSRSFPLRSPFFENSQPPNPAPDSQHVLDRPLSVVLPQAERTPPTKQTTPSSPFVLPLPPLADAEAPDVLKAPPLLTTPSPTPFTPLAPRPVLHPSRPSIAHQTRVECSPSPVRVLLIRVLLH
ncbi:hypothetical protein BLNAU_16388 [Blattamonas nauphoetae]|uniref:Uncharacterized protein n=1 Tax=Blattamonas nauphoetae TaxID=2049346 RepID=A0ABQ9XBJ1_9EUKA|nr:hypothetical protein BLNAU_16388 [Blattamonas nauphoetae]